MPIYLGERIKFYMLNYFGHSYPAVIPLDTGMPQDTWYLEGLIWSPQSMIWKIRTSDLRGTGWLVLLAICLINTYFKGDEVQWKNKKTSSKSSEIYIINDIL